MKILYKKENDKKYIEINLYQDKKDLKNPKEFFNFKTSNQVENTKDFIYFSRSLIMKVKKENEKLAVNFEEVKKISKKLSDFDRAKLFIENIILGEYKFDKYLSEKKDRIKEIIIYGNFTNEEKKAFKEAEIIANSMNFARDLANTPGSEMTPKKFVSIIKKEVKDLNIKVKVFGRKDLEKLKMGMFLAVSRGSKEEPQMLVLEYQGYPAKKNKKLALVGKGVTYDTGGLSLKPSSSMVGMEKDMTGAAVTISTIIASAKLNLNKNLVGIVGLTENAISADSYKPSDVLTSMSGLTVEVKNTDAEGRLVLGDLLTYTGQKIKAETCINLATLTGASLVAVGTKASVVLTKEDDLREKILNYAEKTGDYFWPLPLWKDYEYEMKSDIADLANIGKTRFGGTIQGGIFLWNFAKKENYKWAHLDIAPRMEAEGDEKGKIVEAGSLGEPLRMLVEFIKNYN